MTRNSHGPSSDTVATRAPAAPSADRPGPTSPGPTARGRLGRAGEDLAARHLERAGMVLLHRNWRYASGDVRGELDLVALDGRTLVVCEVKTRRDAAAGGPLEAVDARKLQRLRRLAAAYMAVAAPSGVTGIRVDVVGVTVAGPGGRLRVDHVRGAR